jgi:hypothetical protein
MGDRMIATSADWTRGRPASTLSNVELDLAKRMIWRIGSPNPTRLIDAAQPSRHATVRQSKSIARTVTGMGWAT